MLDWHSAYAHNTETFGPGGTLGRSTERDVVLAPMSASGLGRLNPGLPEAVREDRPSPHLIRVEASRSLLQLNREFYGFIRNGVPVEWRDADGQTQHARARVIDFGRVDTTTGSWLFASSNIEGLRVPHYNRRADLVCFVNGLPLVFVELKAVYRNIREGFDNNLTDYLHPTSIAHAFHHNRLPRSEQRRQAARYGSITSRWEHFVEWKRRAERDEPRLGHAQALLDGMLEKPPPGPRPRRELHPVRRQSSGWDAEAHCGA